MTKCYPLLLTLLLLNNSNVSSSTLAKNLNDSNAKPSLSSTITTSDEINIQAQVEEADKLYWQENYVKAIDVYKNLSDSYVSYDQESRLHWLSSIADCYCRLNDYQQAEKIYTKIAERRKTISGSESTQFANCLSDSSSL